MPAAGIAVSHVINIGVCVVYRVVFKLIPCVVAECFSQIPAFRDGSQNTVGAAVCGDFGIVVFNQIKVVSSRSLAENFAVRIGELICFCISHSA